MIKKTKGEMLKYAGETYDLNSMVVKCNKGFQENGMGVRDEIFE